MNFVDEQIAKFKQRMIDEEIALVEAKKASEKENKRLIKEARNEQIRDRYANDPEFKKRKNDIARRWRLKNKEKVKKWNDDNRETRQEYYREYYLKNKEIHNERSRKWIEENRERHNAMAREHGRRKRAEAKRIQSDK